MTTMTWKAMTAAEACDVADFWIAAGWPMTLAQTIDRAAELGWTVEDEDFLVNEVSGLSMPDVDTATLPSGELSTLTYRTTDVIRNVTEESTAFLNDQFTVLVREGTQRWGRPKLARLRNDTQQARWEIPSGARVSARCSAMAVLVEFTTPQYARVLRDLGE